MWGQRNGRPLISSKLDNAGVQGLCVNSSFFPEANVALTGFAQEAGIQTRNMLGNNVRAVPQRWRFVPTLDYNVNLSLPQMHANGWLVLHVYPATKTQLRHVDVSFSGTYNMCNLCCQSCLTCMSACSLHMQV